jgi:hypothetical protein
MASDLGKLAFVAFVAGHGRKPDHREWPDMQQIKHEAWTAAANAVAAEVRNRCPRCGKPSQSLGTVSLDSMPPYLSTGFECSDEHRWDISWEGG